MKWAPWPSALPPPALPTTTPGPSCASRTRGATSCASPSPDFRGPRCVVRLSVRQQSSGGAAMSSITEVFVSTHDLAVRRAAALDASAAGNPAAELPDAPNARINGITDLEIEILGGLAGKAVHAEEDAALDLADVSSDSLMVAPDSMVRSLAELLTRTDDDDASL